MRFSGKGNNHIYAYFFNLKALFGEIIFERLQKRAVSVFRSYVEWILFLNVIKHNIIYKSD